MIDQTKMSDLVDVKCVSVYDFVGQQYDVIYFSGSLMIMPDPGFREKKKKIHFYFISI